jgi:hypothetical protein
VNRLFGLISGGFTGFLLSVVTLVGWFKYTELTTDDPSYLGAIGMFGMVLIPFGTIIGAGVGFCLRPKG